MSMSTETEVKFLHIDVDAMRSKLRRLSAICEHPMRQMRRVVFNTPEMSTRGGYLRLRDEGDKVTLTYKQFDGCGVDAAKEIEIAVESFDEVLAILEAIGMQPSSYQESRRETWEYRGVEVVIDEWPWVAPYIEIEGESEEAIRQVAAELGFDWGKQAVFGSATVVYQHQFPQAQLDDIGAFRRICFDDPLPQMLKDQ